MISKYICFLNDVLMQLYEYIIHIYVDVDMRLLFVQLYIYILHAA